jgi:hypothetical protein
MSAPERPEPRTVPRRLIAAVAGLVVIAGVAAWLLLSSSPDGRGPSSASATSSAPSTSSPTAPPSPVELGSAAPTDVPQTVLADVPGLPPNLAPVALAARSTFANGVSARLVSVDAVDARAQHPGEISGPALAVTVELTNDGSAPVSLDTVAVSVFAGRDAAPAAPIADGSTAPLSGELGAGASAKATYTFTVPTDLRDVVAVTVSYGGGGGTAIFSGPAA